MLKIVVFITLDLIVFHLDLSNMAQCHAAFCERHAALHERHVALHERHVSLLIFRGGQFHESVNLGVKILKWLDFHFYNLIS